MKVILLTLIVLGMSTEAMASEPQVSCRLIYNLKSERGGTIASKTSPVKEVKPNEEISIQVKDFVLTTTLEEVCASDGLHCTGSYDLRTSISNSEVSTSTSTRTPLQRQYLKLKIGTEEAFSLCDIK